MGGRGLVAGNGLTRCTPAAEDNTASSDSGRHHRVGGCGWAVWVWPDRGIGEFLHRLDVKQREASAVIDQLMPSGVGVTEEEEPGKSDARTAYQLHRLGFRSSTPCVLTGARLGARATPFQ